MTRPTGIPLRRLAILLGVGRRHPALLASMKREFGLADLAEDAERPVSGALADAVFAWLHRQSGDRALGLQLGLDSPINAGGALGVYLAACPTLLAALVELQQWYPLLAWDGSRCRVQSLPRGVLLEVTGREFESIADLLRLDILLGLLLKLGQRLAGEAARPQLIVYPETGHGAPPGLEALAVQQVFARNRFALLFADADAQRPAWHPNARLLELLKPELEKELEQLAKAASLVARIRAWLDSLPTLADAGQAEAAQHFHLSESSLKRRLAEHGTSFSDLLQGYRRDRALELLTGTDDKLESVALVLGFSERASFERAFRTWFDTTPSRYREQIRRLTGGEVSVESLDVDRLPSSPRVCAQILELIDREKENYHLDDLVRLVSLDPQLTAKILGIARSAFYGGRAVRDLGDAIGKVLGVDQVRYLALITAANTEFRGELAPSFDLGRYWADALLRSELAALLPTTCPGSVEIEAYELCLAALLLDIGTFMLAHMHPARMEDFLQRSAAVTSPGERLALEIAAFGSTLRGAGALLLSHWNLPRETVRIVRELESMAPGEETSREARLVAAIADYVAVTDPAARPVAQAAFEEALGRIAGAPAAAARLVARRDARTEEIEAVVAQLLR
jgi:HD-like signal output (HDOD) protein